MSSLAFRGRDIKLTEKGFMENFDDWNDDVCEALAASEDLKLDEFRWRAIRFLRHYYAETGVPPSPHVMVRDIGNQVAHFRCTARNINLLFPGGGCRQACRLAGLPGYFCHGC